MDGSLSIGVEQPTQLLTRERIADVLPENPKMMGHKFDWQSRSENQYVYNAT